METSCSSEEMVRPMPESTAAASFSTFTLVIAATLPPVLWSRRGPRGGRRAGASKLADTRRRSGILDWCSDVKKRLPAQETIDQATRRSLGTGKGAPTPRRKDQEAARKRPLVPNDRKAARDANRTAQADQRLKKREAMNTGDERYLPFRDKGPQKRFVRDFVSCGCWANS